MKYRAEIDGLRALAVIPVIFFHAGFELFNGGFVGVDVFFVISGYLITTILIEDIENKRFSIIHFYERRARRILPALFFVMLVCIPLAWLWMLPSQMKDFSQSLVAVSLFASNILFWWKSGYFDADSEEMPLLHTWSLAVEEQYYLLFPVFLMLAWRFGKHRVFWMIIGVAIISLLLSEWGWRNEATANFYLAPTRVWELLAGAIAAFMVQKNGIQNNNFLAALGLTAIIFSIFAYDQSTPFPSLYTLVPVLGAVLLVLYAHQTTFTARLLSTRLCVAIGLISYSAYLWHQPLFAFARVMQISAPTKIVMLCLSLMSIALAYFTWLFVENYFRNKDKVGQKTIFVTAFLGMFFFSALGVAGHYLSGEINTGKYNPIYPLTTENLGNYVFDNRSLQLQSWNLLRNISDNPRYSVANNPYDDKLWFDENDTHERILLLGNSHSKDIYNILSQSPKFLADKQIARYGAQIRDINNNHRFWGSRNYQEAHIIIIATQYKPEDFIMLPEIIKRVKRDGKNIALVKSIFAFPGESAGLSLIDTTILKNLDLKIEQLALKVNQTYYDYYQSNKQNKETLRNIKMLKIARAYKIPVLNRMDYVCDDKAKLCFAVDDNLAKNFYDYGHHTLNGAEYFAHIKSLPDFLAPLSSANNK